MTLVITEVGSTHGGDRTKMSALIQAAAGTGASVCKFQFCSSPERLAERRQAAEYLEAYRAIAFPAAWLGDLKAECEEAGVEFMATVYLPEDIPVIAPHVRRFKVASFEAVDLPFILAHREYGHQTIISTGGLDETELGRLLELRDAMFGRWDLRLLHCVSAYPTRPWELNLAAIGRYELNGLSDHTLNLWTGALAVAAGAGIVEKHVRLPETPPDNPDYPHSISPDGLAEYIAHIRFAESVLGTGKKTIQPCEELWARYQVRA